jgi:hypothetical protein
MPRHRIEAPGQRTLWRTAEQSARRVRFRAAGRRETPNHAKPAVAPQWRQRLTRNQRRRLNRAGRRLLVSPWFAAGAGVVIATGVIIYMPHTKFEFGNAIHVIHCRQAQCAPVTPEGGAQGLPAGVGGGQVTASPRAITVTAGMSFWYQVLDRTQSGFIMQITIRASHSLGPWKLSFVIPGATDVYVPDARWVQSGTDGGTASNYYSGTESSDSAPISGHQSGGAVSSHDGYTVEFQVRGSGTPRAPTHCFYDGVACQFRQAPAAGAASWPSSR